MCFRIYCIDYDTEHDEGHFCDKCFQDWYKYLRDPCPICYSIDTIKDSLINLTDKEEKPECLHWICIDCLFCLQLCRNKKCPLCRADLTKFLDQNYSLIGEQLTEEDTLLELLRLLNAYNDVLNELLANNTIE